MKMPKRLLTCTVLALAFSLSALASPTPTPDAEGRLHTDVAGGMDIWNLIESIWSNLFSGSEVQPNDLADDTPPTAPPADDQCADPQGCEPGGSQPESLPFGDPNG